MPLPWKKARISQFVADHLHSPKRGGSLVVETGFPTSLVDLFVKNRDRLKKPSKKKQLIAHDPPNPPPSPQLPPPPPPPPPSNHSSSNSIISSSSYGLTSESANQIGDKIVERDVVQIIKQSKIVMGDNKAIETPDANRVLVSVLKVFFVVVLALGTKRFVVGITLSAFLLFFLEYVGKYVYRLFEPCSTAHKILKFLFVRIQHNELEREISCSMAQVEREESTISDSSCSIEGPDLDAPTAETLIVQPNCNSGSRIEQIRGTEGKCNERLGFEGMESKKGVMEREEDDLCEDSKLKHKHSRRATMKSKMKKLVPKKFRSSRKKRSDSKGDVDCPMEEGQEQHKDAEQCELECREKSSTESSGSYDGEEFIVDSTICSSGELSRGDSKAIVEEMGRETKGNSGYWVLCLIVLAGLVGGRILALVLTLCWCLMLKSGGTLRRYIKVPMLRTPVEFSN